MTRKPGLGPLLLAGIAAFGAYKYSKMSEQEKTNLKNKGKKFVDDNLGSLKNMFGKGNNQTAKGFSQTGSSYNQTGSSYNPQG